MSPMKGSSGIISAPVQCPQQIILETISIAPFLLLAAGLIEKATYKPRTKHRLGAQHMLQTGRENLAVSKYLGSGQKRSRVPVLALAAPAAWFKSRVDLDIAVFAAGESHVVLLDRHA